MVVSEVTASSSRLSRPAPPSGLAAAPCCTGASSPAASPWGAGASSRAASSAGAGDEPSTGVSEASGAPGASEGSGASAAGSAVRASWARTVASAAAISGSSSPDGTGRARVGSTLELASAPAPGRRSDSVPGAAGVPGAATAAASAPASSALGSTVTAVLPPCFCARNRTRAPCRWARRATTYRPSPSPSASSLP